VNQCAGHGRAYLPGTKDYDFHELATDLGSIPSDLSLR
jgi:hypothetical protein